MEKLKQSQEIIKLGKKIISEFSNEEKSSVILKWLANYIAELIKNSESEANPKKKLILEKECCDVVLMLWEKRRFLPGKSRPLAHFDRILEIIAALKDRERSFDWDNDDDYHIPGPWGEFIKNIRTNYNDVIRLAIHSSISVDILKKEKDWLNHKSLLSSDEKKIIDNLDALININEIEFYFEKNANNSEQTDRTTKIVNSITRIIEKQNMELEKLKTAIKVM